MDSKIFLHHIQRFPEVLQIIKPKIQYGIFYYESKIDQEYIHCLIDIYTYYFEIGVTLFLPEIKNTIFNTNYLTADLETLEQFSEQGVIIFAYADMIFNDLCKINKRRINTIIKTLMKKSKVIILSTCTLDVLGISIFEKFDKIQLKPPSLINYRSITFNLFDLIEQDAEQFKTNVTQFVEMVNSFIKSKVYISLSLSINKITYIEKILKESHQVFRKEPEEFESGIVLNTSTTTRKTLLKYNYDYYIFVLPELDESLDIVYYFKDILGDTQAEIYLESSNNDQVEKCLMNMYKSKMYLHPKDSKEYTLSSNIEELFPDKEIIFASDKFYRFDAPQTIQNMDIKNLSKKNYDTIRNFIKLKLNNVFDIDIKTCQLGCPCSPKDRSKKLNSLSNKISSIDYRCDVTCELFKDYTIGVVIWNETFADKTFEFSKSENSIYIYQTTMGTWKYTTIN